SKWLDPRGARRACWLGSIVRGRHRGRAPKSVHEGIGEGRSRAWGHAISTVRQRRLSATLVHDPEFIPDTVSVVVPSPRRDDEWRRGGNVGGVANEGRR